MFNIAIKAENILRLL